MTADARDLFNSLNPKQFGLLEWPEGDDGEKSGDEQIAEVIHYGRGGPLRDEDAILFAIKIGRALAKEEITNRSMVLVPTKITDDMRIAYIGEEAKFNVRGIDSALAWSAMVNAAIDGEAGEIVTDYRLGLERAAHECEWMARGYAAYLMQPLLDAAARIREIPDDPNEEPHCKRKDGRKPVIGFGVREPKFKIGQRVEKVKGSRWTGTVVGTYSTKLTPEGYAVESENEIGSVQIYPASALTLAKPFQIGEG